MKMQHYYKRVIFVGVVVTSTCLYAMETQEEVAVPSVDTYNEVCEVIDGQQQKKMTSFFMQKSAYKSDFLHEHFTKKLEKIAAEIKDIEEKNVDALRQEFCINDEIWDIIVRFSTAIKRNEDAHKYRPLPKAIHDQLLPAAFLGKLTKHLAQKGINSRRVTIQYTQDSYDYSPPIPMCSVNNGELIFPKISQLYYPAEISIPFDHTFLSDEQEAFGFLFAHLIDEKQNVFYVTLAASAPFFGCEVKQVLESPFYQRYFCMNIPLGIIKMALKHQYYAHLMNIILKRNIFYTNDTLTPYYFYKLSSRIKRYWDIVAHLDCCHH